MPDIRLTDEQCRQVRAMLGDYAALLARFERDYMHVPNVAALVLRWRSDCLRLQAFFRTGGK
jgi:hypothetical protein